MSWALPGEAVRYLSRRVRRTDTILELGSGDGTLRLGEMCKRVFSVEHDEEWLGKYPAVSNYIHAPIVDGWYDVEVLKRELPRNYHCIVVDGPPGRIGRMGFLKNLALFANVPILIDDIQRKPEYELAIGVAEARKANISMHYTRDRRGYATVGWPA